MESLKRRPAEKERRHVLKKINVTFNVIIGLVILLGVITLFRVLEDPKMEMQYLQSGSRLILALVVLIPCSPRQQQSFNRCDQ